MDGQPPVKSRLSRCSILWIALFGATMSLVDFGPGWALTYHEAYFAEPAREMLRTGDWLIPRIGGVPSWQKPPLTHWMIAATMGILHTEAEWAVRLPTVLCTILNALFIAALAARWHGDRIGRLAGLIQLTTFYGLFQGRLAESDMPLCAAISGAMMALAYGTIDRASLRLSRVALVVADQCSAELGKHWSSTSSAIQESQPETALSRWWPRLAFFAAAGLSTLIKGPFGLALIGGAAGLFAMTERRWNVWRFLLDPVGWLVMIALTIAWPLAAYRADPTILQPNGVRKKRVLGDEGSLNGDRRRVRFVRLSLCRSRRGGGEES